MKDGMKDGMKDERMKDERIVPKVRLALLTSWFFLSSSVGYLYWVLSIGQRENRVNPGFIGFFGWGVRHILGLKIEVEGAGNLSAHRPCVFVGNHQSALDLALFGELVARGTVSIGKRELVWIPIFGPLFVLGGNITIRREKHRHAFSCLESAAEAIRRKGVSIFCFPEGTRNRSQGKEMLLPFKKGAFYIAIKAGVPVVPIVCSPLDGLLDLKKGIVRPGVVRIKVLPPVSTRGLNEKQIGSLTQKIWLQMHEALHSLAARPTPRKRDRPDRVVPEAIP